jgi:IS5 family transposase
MARHRRVIRGRRLRVDTTVVETNIHYPTDSSLLGDGVRVVQRGLKQLGQWVGGLQVRDRMRSVRRRVFEIARLSRRAHSPRAQLQRRRRYRELMGVVRATVREAERALRSVARRPLVESIRARVDQLSTGLRENLKLVQRVLAQTRARIVGGDTHYPDKLLSLFEPHSEAIRKGKAAKPTEFGKLVKIQEAEAQFITDYQVYARRPPDQALWVPALEKHRELFGRPPRLAVADAGFASTANRREAERMGVKRVALPGKAKGQGRWLRRALRWRTGSEGRISALKRRHGLDRCRYRGLEGMERWVGLGVLANNLLAFARAQLASP